MQGTYDNTDSEYISCFPCPQYCSLERRRKRKIKTTNVNISPKVGVRKDSVIGVYMGTNNPLPVIGMSNANSIPDHPIGACVTSSTNESISNLLCNSQSNMSNIIIHAEAKISKSI